MKKVILFVALALVCAASFAQTKIGYVNYGELVQLVPAADSARAQISAATKEAQDTYQSMMEEFQSKYQQYQQKQASWTPAIKESKEKELGDIQNRIQEFNETVQMELQQQQQVLMAPIMQNVTETVSRLAKASGIAVVFDSSSLLYYDEAQCIDLTPAARKSLKIPDGRTLETLQAELMAQQGQ